MDANPKPCGEPEASWLVRWRNLGRDFLHTRTCRNSKCRVKNCEKTREILRQAALCKAETEAAKSVGDLPPPPRIHQCTDRCKMINDLLRHLETCINARCKICITIRPTYPDLRKPDTVLHGFPERRARVQKLGLLYMHAETCVTSCSNGRPCKTPQCADAKQRIEHMHHCTGGAECPHDWCLTGRIIRKHITYCESKDCKICVGSIRASRGAIPYNKDFRVEDVRSETRELIRRYFAARKVDMSGLLMHGFTAESSFESASTDDMAATYVEQALFDTTPTLEWYLRTLALMWIGGYSGYLGREHVDDISLGDSIRLFNKLRDTLKNKFSHDVPPDEAELEYLEGLAETFWATHRRSMKAPKTSFSKNASRIHVDLWRRLGELDRNLDVLGAAANR